MGMTFELNSLLSFALISSVAASRLALESFIAERNANEPYATFDAAAVSPHHKGGCYKGAVSQLQQAAQAPFSFTDEEIRAASVSGVSVDWRDHGAVGPVQQQHPFGTCWAFSMTAVTEAISVIQGKNKFEKLSEQMTVSCTPPSATGDNSDVLWSWALHNTGNVVSISISCRVSALLSPAHPTCLSTCCLYLSQVVGTRPRQSIPTIVPATATARPSSRPMASLTATTASATSSIQPRQVRVLHATPPVARTAPRHVCWTRARAFRRLVDHLCQSNSYQIYVIHVIPDSNFYAINCQ